MKPTVAGSAAVMLAAGLVIASPPVSAFADSVTSQDVANRDTRLRTTSPTPIKLGSTSIAELDPGIHDLDKGIEDVKRPRPTVATPWVTLDTDILFDFDSSELSDSAKKKITDLVKDLPTDSEITVGGHTDSKGRGRLQQETLRRPREGRRRGAHRREFGPRREAKGLLGSPNPLRRMRKTAKTTPRVGRRTVASNPLRRLRA